MSRTLPLICASLMLAAAAPAFAQDPPPVSQRVYIGDLDLYNTKDADQLLDRVDSAAGGLCADRSRPVSATEERVAVECETVAVENTVEDLNHPMVTARHNGLNPQVVIEGSADPYDPVYKPKA